MEAEWSVKFRSSGVAWGAERQLSVRMCALECCELVLAGTWVGGVLDVKRVLAQCTRAV